jgi:hypothetical protein
MADAFREVLHLERRLVKTLWSLFARPGWLTTAYLEGRRADWVSPIRLYLLTSVVFGAALVFADDTVRVSLQGAEPDRTAWLRFWVWSVLFMMPVFAGLMMLAIRRGRYFVEHLVFAIHFHAFAFLVAAIGLPVVEVSRSALLSVSILLGVPAVIWTHLVMAVRRRYELTVARALGTSLVVSFAYLLVLFMMFVATGVLANRIAPS